MLKRCVQIVIINVLLAGVLLVSAQEPAALRLFVGPDALILYVNSGPVWVGDLEFRWVVAGGETDHRQLMADFDALQLTAGYAKTGSCFVYQLDKSASPLPNVCNQATLVFRRSVLPSDVFWYNRAFDQSQTLLVIGGGTDALGIFCPGGSQDCPLVWEVTPSPMRSSTETPVISPTVIPADPLQAALELARTPVAHNADWTPVTYMFDGVEMVLVPAGCFEMGNDPEAYYWDDKTHNWVQGVPDGGQQCFEQPFWLDKYEVTNAQYKQCVDAGVCTPPSDRTYYDDAAYADHPVVYVDWSQAQAYAEWRGCALPTEREWEYAARGPDALFFPWGNDFVAKNLVYGENSGGQTAKVGSKPGGASWVGALDLSGNVWEWGSNTYQFYPYDQDDGRENASRTDVSRILRGGSWVNAVPVDLRATPRLGFTPENRLNAIGFRCARSAFITETLIFSPTATPTPTLQATVTPTDPLQAALGLARTPVAHNADWTPVTHTFDGVEMVLVPAGCFEMGNDPEAYYWNGSEHVQGVPDGDQQCFEQPFWLDKYEVTNAQYKDCVDAGVCKQPFDRTYYEDAAYADHPVVYVDWSQAQTYAEWRGSRLPTEREWEYAARGPDALFFPWGNDFDGTRLNYCDKNCPYDSRDTAVDDGYSTTAPVGSYPLSLSWVGALDLSGNVWEWMSSASAAYPYDSVDGRENVDGTEVRRVLRGGSWVFTYSVFLRAASHYGVLPGSRDNGIGFRCARSAFITDTLVFSPTATPTPTLQATVTPTDPLQAALELARTPVAHNADWTPVPYTFEGVEMVLVPAGCFEMGSEDGYSDEKPVHQQCFDEPFWLDKYEVTNAQYKQCVNTGVCTPPRDRTYYDNVVYAEHPVVNVDWFQAQVYAEWRNGRLPTEREWEYAARGPDTLFFPWGNEFDGTRLNYCDKNCDDDGRDTAVDDGYSSTAPVGSYPGGTSWVGVLDLSGNVWEWVSSAFVAYPYGQADGRENVDRTDVSRVLRGGSWKLTNPAHLHAAYRLWFTPDDRDNNWGFRCFRLP